MKTLLNESRHKCSERDRQREREREGEGEREREWVHSQ